jgi:hypothetical protein
VLEVEVEALEVLDRGFDRDGCHRDGGCHREGESKRVISMIV